MSVEPREAAFYVLVATNQELVSAVEIARSRLTAGEWPMYPGTRNVQAIKKGDRCVIYTAGSGDCSRCFVGSATIAGVRVIATRWDARPASQRPRGEITGGNQWVEPVGLAFSRPARKVLSLIEQNNWRHPIHISEVVEKLEFIRNKARWSQVFQGGCRAITKADYELLSGLDQ